MDKEARFSHKILAFDEEAFLQQAYEAMRSLGFIFSHGFRAKSQPGHHIAIIEFVQSRIDKMHRKAPNSFYAEDDQTWLAGWNGAAHHVVERTVTHVSGPDQLDDRRDLLGQIPHVSMPFCTDYDLLLIAHNRVLFSSLAWHLQNTDKYSIRCATAHA
ncbi:MAG TPA: hypothetical protein VEI52_11095 [Terriglobales bacterium]|nr:hypothetical protein [Terriglobales bacterium]